MSIIYLGFVYFLDIFKRPFKNLGVVFNIFSVTISLAFSIFTISIFRGISINTLSKISELNGDLHFKDKNDIGKLDNKIEEIYKTEQLVCFLVNNFNNPIQLKSIPPNNLESIFGKYIRTSPQEEFGLPVYVGESFIIKNAVDPSKPFPVCAISAQSWELETIICKVCGIFKTGLAYFDEGAILTTSELPKDLLSCTYYTCHLNKLHKADIDKLKGEKKCATWKMLFSEIYEVFNLSLKLIFLLLITFFIACALQMFTVLFQIIHNNSLHLLILRQLGASSYQRWKIFACFCCLLTIFIVVTSNGIAVLLISIYNSCDNFLIRIFNINTSAIGISSIKCSLLIKDLIFIDIFALLIMLAFSYIGLYRRT